MFPSPYSAHMLEPLTKYIGAPGFVGSTALTPFINEKQVVWLV